MKEQDYVNSIKKIGEFKLKKVRGKPSEEMVF
jgi:hypothetical protein